MSDAPAVRRILIALSGGAEELLWLETIADLAARLDAELATLFIEDELLLAACRLPFMREVGRVSAAARLIDSRALEQRLRSAAGRVERLLQQAAARRSLRSSFQIARGRLIESLLEAAQDLDAVLLWGDTARPVARRARLLAVLGPGPEAARELRLAVRLAHALQAELVLATARDGGEPERFAQLIADAGTPRPQLYRLPNLAAASVAHAAVTLGASLVIAPTDHDLGSAELGRLVAGLPCPILLLK